MKHLLACLAALGLLSAPAAAQDAPAGEGEIVVSGQTPRQAQQFATRLSIDDPYSPLPLYEPGAFCPGVVGLSEAQNQAIAARMVQVAQATGMKPAGAGCRTSALVIFDTDREALLKRFRALHPEYFQELTGDQITYSGRHDPVMAWQIIARLNRNNMPVGVTEDGIQMVAVTTGMTRLDAATRPIVVMSVLLIEKRAVRGLTAQQIGDYALMRSVTDRAPDSLHVDPMQTILKVIDVPQGAASPLSLTRWDQAYVTSRYAVNRWNLGPTQMASIRAAMKHSGFDLGDD